LWQTECKPPGQRLSASPSPSCQSLYSVSPHFSNSKASFQFHQSTYSSPPRLVSNRLSQNTARAFLSGSPPPARPF